MLAWCCLGSISQEPARVIDDGISVKDSHALESSTLNKSGVDFERLFKRAPAGDTVTLEVHEHSLRVWSAIRSRSFMSAIQRC